MMSVGGGKWTRQGTAAGTPASPSQRATPGLDAAAGTTPGQDAAADALTVPRQRTRSDRRNRERGPYDKESGEERLRRLRHPDKLERLPRDAGQWAADLDAALHREWGFEAASSFMSRVQEGIRRLNQGGGAAVLSLCSGIGTSLYGLAMSGATLSDETKAYISVECDADARAGHHALASYLKDRFRERVPARALNDVHALGTDVVELAEDPERIRGWVRGLRATVVLVELSWPCVENSTAKEQVAPGSGNRPSDALFTACADIADIVRREAEARGIVVLVTAENVPLFDPTSGLHKERDGSWLTWKREVCRRIGHPPDTPTAQEAGRLSAAMRQRDFFTSGFVMTKAPRVENRRWGDVLNAGRQPQLVNANHTQHYPAGEPDCRSDVEFKTPEGRRAKAPTHVRSWDTHAHRDSAPAQILEIKEDGVDGKRVRPSVDELERMLGLYGPAKGILANGPSDLSDLRIRELLGNLVDGQQSTWMWVCILAELGTAGGSTETAAMVEVDRTDRNEDRQDAGDRVGAPYHTATRLDLDASVPPGSERSDAKPEGDELAGASQARRELARFKWARQPLSPDTTRRFTWTRGQGEARARGRAQHPVTGNRLFESWSLGIHSAGRFAVN